MTQITRVPQGLQDFLGTQAQGKNPSELGQVVAPILDMGPFFGIEKEQWYAESLSFAADNVHSINVPNGEMWILKGIGARHDQSGMNVGDGYTCSTLLTNIPNSESGLLGHPIGDPYTYVVASATNDVNQLSELNNVVVWPGSRISWEFVAGTYAGAGTFIPHVCVRYLELKV